MVFNSYEFILFFLPIIIIGYFVIGKYSLNGSKLLLVVASIFFYYTLDAKFTLLLVLIATLNFIVGQILRGCKQIKKGILILGILLNIALLLYFKYYNFMLTSINLIFSSEFNLLKIALPLGISFFTFQNIAYIVDVYNEKCEYYTFLDYLLFICYFPKIMQGPIVMHSDFIPQLAKSTIAKFSHLNMNRGLYSFAWGLSKKVLLADTLAYAVNYCYNHNEFITNMNFISTWFIIIAYSLQLYFDFSGYCDMASGISYFFNINLPDNFANPYKSLDVLEFWKRWHITLTQFFTKYVYIPLGGNRKGKYRSYLNNLIVFLVSGLWHGANYTFLLWGLLHGLASVFTKVCKKYIDKLHCIFRWLFTFLFVSLAWVVFRANTISQAIFIIKKSLTFNLGIIDYDLLYNMFPVELRLMFNYLRLGPLALTIICITFIIIIFICIFKMKPLKEQLNNFCPSVFSQLYISFLLVYSLISISGVTTFLYVNF